MTTTTKALDAALLPCPFCGSTAPDIGGMLPWVQCALCDASSRSCDNEAEAAAAWNRRVASPSAGVEAVAWRYRYADCSGWTYQQERPGDPPTGNPLGKVIEPLFGDTQPEAAPPPTTSLRAVLDDVNLESVRWENGDDAIASCNKIASMTMPRVLDALGTPPEAAPKVDAATKLQALEAIYADFEAKDNGDVPLEQYPHGAIAALARAGWAVVPCNLPFSVLGDAALAGVFDTGNPKHGWDYLLARTRIGPNVAALTTPGGGS